MKLISTFALALVAALTLTASASAATRYASPTGLASLGCPQVAPCDLTSAVNAAAIGDEVVVLSGTYNIAPTNANIPGISTPNNVTIRGETTGAPPLLKIAPTEAARAFIVNPGVTLRDMRISYEGTFATNVGLYTYEFAVVDRVHMDGGSNSFATCSITKDVTYTNSACLSRGSGGAALMFSLGMNTTFDITMQGTVRNSTFVATGDSAEALSVLAGNLGTGALTLRVAAINSIFETTGGGANDVELVSQYDVNNLASLIASNSNYSGVATSGPGSFSFTATTAGGNQAAEPLLTDLAAGDLSQLPASPTIDAGADDPANGTLDLAGKGRTAGARTDIGAYEYQPPVAPPQPEYALSAAALSPKTFRAAAKGATLRPPSARPKTKRGQKPIGSILKFNSTDGGEVDAYAYRVLKGRKSKTGKCGRPSRANARGKRCTYHKRLKGSATAAVTAGENRFYFTGRWGGKKLVPGSYLVVLKHKLKGSGIPSSNGDEAGTIKGTIKLVK